MRMRRPMPRQAQPAICTDTQRSTQHAEVACFGAFGIAGGAGEFRQAQVLTGKDKRRQTDKQTYTQTDGRADSWTAASDSPRQTDRQTEMARIKGPTETGKCRHTYRQPDRPAQIAHTDQTCRTRRDKQTGRQTGKQPCKHLGSTRTIRMTDRQTQTGAGEHKHTQPNRQTDTRTDRPAARQTLCCKIATVNCKYDVSLCAVELAK